MSFLFVSTCGDSSCLSFCSLSSQNGSAQFVSASKLPLPKEKHDETYNATPDLASTPQPDSDSELDMLDFPEVPKM